MDNDLQALIESSFDSVWTLELLLVLWSKPDRHWTPDELIGELRSSEQVLRQSIGTLSAGGLVAEQADGRYSYAPATTELAALIPRLVEEYRSRPATVRRMIVAPQNTKLQTFADAFLFRKPGK